MIQYQKRKVLKYDKYYNDVTGLYYFRGDAGFNEHDLLEAHGYCWYTYRYDRDSNYPIGFLTIIIVPFLGMIGCQASIHGNTAKHRKDPEKHPETTPTNVSSKTVAIQ